MHQDEHGTGFMVVTYKACCNFISNY